MTLLPPEVDRADATTLRAVCRRWRCRGLPARPGLRRRERRLSVGSGHRGPRRRADRRPVHRDDGRRAHRLGGCRGNCRLHHSGTRVPQPPFDGLGVVPNDPEGPANRQPAHHWRRRGRSHRRPRCIDRVRDAACAGSAHCPAGGWPLDSRHRQAVVVAHSVPDGGWTGGDRERAALTARRTRRAAVVQSRRDPFVLGPVTRREDGHDSRPAHATRPRADGDRHLPRHMRRILRRITCADGVHGRRHGAARVPGLARDTGAPGAGTHRSGSRAG